MDITLKNGITPRGRVTLPPSKSEAIRAALLLALAGDDPMRAAEGFPAPYCGDLSSALKAAGDLRSAHAGESAALMRMLMPVQAALFGRISVGADGALLNRGFGELERCFGVSLEPRGGRIETRVNIRRKRRFTIDCSRTSQFLSGLLIALPLLDRECAIIVENRLVSQPYAEMTLDFVRLFGGAVERTETGYRTFPSRYAAPETIPVTGDASYAAVFEAMDLLGGEVETVGGSFATRQPDAEFLRCASERDVDITDCPDLLPLLAAVACGREGETVIHGTARLRTKESDREAATVKLIRDLGGAAEVGSDRVTVRGSGGLAGGVCDSLNDHRIAFAAAVLAQICRAPVTVKNAGCTEKSAPGFWEDYGRLTADERR